MAIATFLAMTAAEIRCCTTFPEKIGWMACHFSPHSQGLSNIPRQLPSGSLLILDDSVPILGHDRFLIARQLVQCVQELSCCGLLLDFQRPENEALQQLTAHLLEALPCPVAVSAQYAKNRNCPVFLPPVPHHIPLAEHIAPWQGREIWLEIAMDCEEILLTESGATFSPLPRATDFAEGYAEEMLHCHYRAELTDNAAKFTLCRTAEDLKDLLAEAEELGISTAVGLYQELHANPT